jgi:hypothetical protein
MNISVRQARRELYKIDSIEADKLRRDLFEHKNQDSTIPLKYRSRYQEIVSPKKEEINMKQPTLEEVVMNILLQEERSPNFESHADKVIEAAEQAFDKLRNFIEKNSDILIKNSGVDLSVHKLYQNRVNKIKDLLSEAESIFITDIIKDLE